MSFEEVAQFYNLPLKEIAPVTDKRLAINLTPYSFIEDLSTISYPTLTRFMETFLGFSKKTFKTRFVEPGYGLRVDLKGELGKFLKKILDENIPLFINTFDLEKDNKEKRAYVINGFEI